MPVPFWLLLTWIEMLWRRCFETEKDYSWVRSNKRFQRYPNLFKSWEHYASMSPLLRIIAVCLPYPTLEWGQKLITTSTIPLLIGDSLRDETSLQISLGSVKQWSQDCTKWISNATVRDRPLFRSNMLRPSEREPSGFSGYHSQKQMLSCWFKRGTRLHANSKLVHLWERRLPSGQRTSWSTRKICEHTTELHAIDIGRIAHTSIVDRVNCFLCKTTTILHI